MIKKNEFYSVLMLLILITLATRMQISVYAQELSGTLTFDGQQRSYYLYVPASYDKDEAAALVVALHSGFSSGRALAALSGLNDAADEDGFIVVYPQNLYGGWADGRFEAGIESAQTQIVDDTDFIGAVIDEVASEHNIDTSQVHLVGLSNGGLFAYRMVCEAPELFDSVAIVSSLMWQYQVDACQEVTHPVNMLIIHGTADFIYHTESRDLSDSFDPSYHPHLLGVDDTVSFLAERQGCGQKSETDVTNAHVYSGCMDDTTIAYYGIDGGGQAWPRVGDFKLNQYGVDATQMIVKFFNGDESWLVPQEEPYSETPRTYSVYVPSNYDRAQAMPVMMLLHGRFGTGAGTASLTEMNDLAEEHGFIGVYPDGLRYPNAEEGDYGWRYGFDYGLNDLSEDTIFLDNLIDDLSQTLNIDQDRIYVSGFSNGGFMVHRLACEDPHRFAAFASVSGSGFPGIVNLCDEDFPVPMLIIHGTADNNILWDGIIQEINGQRFYSSYPVLDMAGFWAGHNHCSNQVDSEELPQSSPETLVRILRVGGCPRNGKVEVVGILGGGHNWPGMPGKISEAVAGNVNTDINAGEVIWEFASQFPEPEVETEATPELESTFLPGATAEAETTPEAGE